MGIAVSRGHIPIRTCIVCGAKRPRGALLRTALDGQQGSIVLDERQTLQGRGAYVCPACLPRLRFDKRAQKAFRGQATGLAESIRKPLDRAQHAHGKATGREG